MARLTEEVFNRKYTLLEKIGEGGTAVIRLAVDNITNKRVAVKCISKHLKIINLKEKIKNEISAMTTLTHKNIIQAIDILETEDAIKIVMPYCEDGDLFELINSCEDFSEAEIRSMFKKIVDGIEYCHSTGLCHRDLKLENIFLCNNKTDLMIGDWGFCAEYSETTLLTDSCGSLPFAAPEIIKGEPYKGPEVDIWSLGVVLFCMITANYPFDDLSDDEEIIKSKINAGKYPKPNCSKSCKRLLRKMLEPDRHKRITLPEIISSTWMNRKDKKRSPRSSNF